MCVCNEGFVMDGGKCIKREQCGCPIEGGLMVENGYEQMDDDCRRTCKCERGRYTCKAHSCDAALEVCGKNKKEPRFGQCQPKEIKVDTFVCSIVSNNFYYDFDGNFMAHETDCPTTLLSSSFLRVTKDGDLFKFLAGSFGRYQSVFN